MLNKQYQFYFVFHWVSTYYWVKLFVLRAWAYMQRGGEIQLALGCLHKCQWGPLPTHWLRIDVNVNSSKSLLLMGHKPFAMLCLIAQLGPTLWDPARFLCPWESPGKNTRVGSHALLQGIFPSQGLNPGLLHSRRILYRLSHQGLPISLLIYHISGNILSIIPFVIIDYCEQHLELVLGLSSL